MSTNRVLGLPLALSFSLLVFHLTGCGGEDCKETKYRDSPSSVVACHAGMLTVRSMPCFGKPDTCSYTVTGGKLSFTVAKETCSSGEAMSTGCASTPDEFECSGAPLAAGTYELDSSRELEELAVAADGTCVRR